jgi:hypothetical protein
MSNLRHFVTSALAKWVAALKLRDEALRLNSPSLRLRCGEHSADSDVIARCYDLLASPVNGELTLL